MLQTLQTLIYETDSSKDLLKVLDTIIRTIYKEAPGQYSQLHIKRNVPEFRDGKTWLEPKVHSECGGLHQWVDIGGWSKPSYMHICTIGDYKSDIKEGDETFYNFNELIRAVEADLKLADIKKFRELCGDGYDDFFNEDDGSVGLGYRLLQRPMGGWNYLDIAFCHIYYGK